MGKKIFIISWPSSDYNYNLNILFVTLKILNCKTSKCSCSMRYLNNWILKKLLILTHLFSVHSFSTPWKYQNTVSLSLYLGVKKGKLRIKGLKHIFNSKRSTLEVQSDFTVEIQKGFTLEIQKGSTLKIQKGFMQKCF